MSVAILSSIIPSNSLAPLWSERFPASIRPDLVVQSDSFDGDGAINGRVIPWRKGGQAQLGWASPAALFKTAGGVAYYDSTTAADQVFGYVEHSGNGEAMASVEWGGGARVAGLTFRMGTISNYWDFVLRSTGAVVRKTVAGATANQGTALSFVPVVGGKYRMHVRFNAATIVATIVGPGLEPATITIESNDMQGNARSGLTVGILHKILDFSF